MKTKRIVSIFLICVMVLTAIQPFSVFAETVKPVIAVESVSGAAGDTVDMLVTIKGNPGILGATLKLEYESGLTLTGAASGDAFSTLTFSKPGKFTSPCIFGWDGQDLTAEQIKDGTILNLQFKIDESVEAGNELLVKLSYAKGDIVDASLNRVNPDILNGIVNVIDYMPGNLNDDDVVNMSDVILYRRYIVGGYDATINEAAADVNNDQLRNMTDVILMRRYIVGGYDVELLPSKPACNHTMEATPYKAPTCTEDGNIAYWQCTKCDNYYLDANGTSVTKLADTVVAKTGHSVVIDSAIEPTYESVGWTEGKHCSACGEILLAQEEIPVLVKDEYHIQYIYGMVPQNIDYLKSADEYKPSQGKALEEPILDKYKFLGWSDKDGKMYGRELPKGTSGDLVLYANWASDRNRAVPAKKLGDPIICEDSDNGMILFVYEIGKIENVPIFEKYNILSANGIITKGTRKEQKSIQKGNAETIGKSIANTTTNSTTWTMSTEWNETTSVSEEWAEQQGMELTEAEEFCKSNSNTYNMTNSSGGSENLINSDNSSYRITGAQAHEDSTYNEEQKYAKFNVDGKLSNSTTVSGELSGKLSAGLKIPLKVAEGSVGAEVGAKVGASNTFAWEIGAGYEQSKFTKDITTGTDSWENTIDISNSKSTTVNTAKTWNSSEGFTASQQTSSSSAVSKAISELISKKHSTDSSYTTGGINGESQEYASSNANEDSYSSSVTYSEEEIVSNEITIETTANVHGSYRIVHAGTAKVFAVVGYDIKNKSYFTYTHSVLDDDEYKEYLDYSYDATFDDYETSVLPFEIPGFVNDYVNSRILTSKLQINDEGIVTKYLGAEDDEIVFIPSYYTKINSTTGETEMLKIRGIAPGLFMNNTNIIGVSLGNFVNEIPDSAFEGCTSLKEIVCPNVVSIGANALKGCSSLSEFTLPNEIEFIGEGAFDGIPAIKCNASTKEFANIVANSNVSNITLDISKIEAEDFSDMCFEIGEIETFKLLGGRKEYKGLTIKSDAATTIISGVTISECNGVPVELSSPNVTLERVTAQSDGFALILKADETTLSIEGVSSMLSKSEYGIIAKTINMELINEETYSSINTDSTILVYGEVNNNDGFVDEEKIVIITEEEYVNYLTQRKVTFDAGDGNIGINYTMVPFNGPVGELPSPSRDFYSFDGWYTDSEDGEKVTADTIISEDITLYAHWILNDAVWGLKSDMPEGAEIVNTKYTYTKTYYEESSSSSMSGWTQYKNPTWVWSSWGSWSGWQDSAISGSESREVGTQTVLSHYNKKTQYLYSRYYCWSSSKGYYLAAPYKTGDCINYEDTGWLDYRLNYEKTQSFGGNSYSAYGRKQVNSKDIYWYNETSRQVDNTDSPVYKTQYRYRDRYKVYTYYFTRSEEKESTTYPSGSNISNIKEHVQYRAK